MDLKKELEYIYDKKIKVVRGKAARNDVVISPGNTEIDIVVYLRTEQEVAIVWNQQRRREFGSTTHTFNWEYDINYQQISCGYIDSQKHMFIGKKQKRDDECVLVMSFRTLVENIYNLYDLMQYPDEDSVSVARRGRNAVNRWNRNAEFRNKVLRAYSMQCAICRCTEENILQAAHIKAVADGGSDNVSNGICLCANHHLMLDNNLICIDYKNDELSYIADSVKCMPWYSIFLQNGGKILRRRVE